jgi:hypothetical protein
MATFDIFPTLWLSGKLMLVEKEGFRGVWASIHFRIVSGGDGYPWPERFVFA